MFHSVFKRKQHLFDKPLSVSIGDFLAPRSWLTLLLTVLFWAVIIALAFALLTSVIYTIVQSAFDINSLQNPVNNVAVSVISGLIGAIIGAVVGGIVSILLQTKQLQSGAAISRRDIVYKPIRDEALILQQSLKNDKYPPRVILSDERFLNGISARFTIWPSIQDTSMSIDLPKWLRDGLNKFVDTIEKYADSFRNAEVAITKEIDGIFNAKFPDKYPVNGNIRVNQMNIARDVVTRDWHTGTLLSQFDQPIQYVVANDWDQLESIIYEQFQELPAVKNIEFMYELLNLYLVELITEMEKRIIYINFTYEGQTNRF